MRQERITSVRGILSKVPEVTIYFWIIKILCTTVGETFSDFLNVNMGLGLTGTSVAMGLALSAVIFFQFRATRYIPSLYWLTVVLISVFGTLITDNLTDRIGVPLEVSTIVFSAALAVTFLIWFSYEKTLSIHSIFTRRREVFYWLAILFTFALGTASGDLMAERLGLGYATTGVIVASIIVAVTASWKAGLDSVLSFWIAYIMTRPLGASLGDLLSQTRANGGLGFGATATSILFLASILITVIFLSLTKKDLIAKQSSTQAVNGSRRVSWQVAISLSVILIASGVGYHLRQNSIRNAAARTASVSRPLGDLSVFRTITHDTLALVQKGDLVAARTRVTDLETAWDNAAAVLDSVNHEKWSMLDRSIDNVLQHLRASNPDQKQCQSSIETLMNMLSALDMQKRAG